MREDHALIRPGLLIFAGRLPFPLLNAGPGPSGVDTFMVSSCRTASGTPDAVLTGGRTSNPLEDRVATSIRSLLFRSIIIQQKIEAERTRPRPDVLRLIRLKGLRLQLAERIREVTRPRRSLGQAGV